MIRIFRFLARGRIAIMAAAIVAAVINGAAGASLIFVIQGALAGRFAPGPSGPAWFAGLCVLVLVTHLVAQFLVVRAAERAACDLRLALSSAILTAPLRTVEEVGSPRLLVALTEDVQALSTMLAEIPGLCMNVAAVAACLGYFAFLSGDVLVAVMVFMIAGNIAYHAPLLVALRYLDDARRHQSTLFGHYRDLTAGCKELKLNAGRREAFLSGALTPTAEAVRRASVAGLTLFSCVTTWGRLLYLIFIGLILFVLARVRPISPEGLTGAVLTGLYLMGPLAMALQTLPILGRAHAALEALERLGLSLSAGTSEPRRVARLPRRHWSSLRLDAVTHAYRGEDGQEGFVLGPVDLELRPGEIVFLTGGNGSGKTTLAKLLVGLYIPDSGRVVLDGRDVAAVDADEYRQHFSAVFADFHLFNSLAGLDGDDSEAEARQYLDVLGLGDRVRINAGAFSSTTLSQGQRKRLALLVACLEHRPIFVFDEWAADQDSRYRALFYERLLPELRARGKTVVAVTHDERYHHHADRIVRLDYGRVIAIESPALPAV